MIEHCVVGLTLPRAISSMWLTAVYNGLEPYVGISFMGVAKPTYKSQTGAFFNPNAKRTNL